MIDNLDRRSFMPIVDISMPSIKILPEAGSVSLNKADAKDVFPEKKSPTLSTKLYFVIMTLLFQ